VTDPSECSTATDPKTRCNDEPEDGSPERTIVDLPDSWNKEAQDSRSARVFHHSLSLILSRTPPNKKPRSLGYAETVHKFHFVELFWAPDDFSVLNSSGSISKGPPMARGVVRCCPPSHHPTYHRDTDHSPREKAKQETHEWMDTHETHLSVSRQKPSLS